MLGLDNLLSFANEWPATSKSILDDSNNHSNWFSFAITGINLTADAFDMLRKKKYGQLLYTAFSCHPDIVLYCCITSNLAKVKCRSC